MKYLILVGLSLYVTAMYQMLKRGMIGGAQLLLFVSIFIVLSVLYIVWKLITPGSKEHISSSGSFSFLHHFYFYFFIVNKFHD